MNQIVYYLLTLLVCAVFHELGHAIAAIWLVLAFNMRTHRISYCAVVSNERIRLTDININLPH